MSVLKKHSARKSSLLKKSRSKSQDVEYTAQNLPSLRRQRTVAYKRMCKALEVGVSVGSDRSQQDMFFSYHQDIKKIASNFEDAHFAILEILDDAENEDSDLQERFDEMYYRVISIYRSLTKNESYSSHSHCNSLSNIRLPKIQLPTFDGDLKHFPEYIDTFNALIHNATSLSDTEKFHYLISSLSGDALTVVKTFPLSSQHYGDAYAALIARYKCKRELAFTCWRDILNMNFNLKDAYEFRKSLDLFEENLCILKSVSLPVNHWDFVLVYHILSKLDTTIRRDFEEKHSNIELPSYALLKEFLHSKCEALVRDTHFIEQVKQNKPAPKISSQSAQSKRVPASYTLIASNESLAEVSGSMTATRPVTCSFCNESHRISLCPEFLKKSVDERMKIATDRNWCFNCLKSSHQLKNCNSVFSCQTCRRKHHSLLHRYTSAEPRETVSALVSRSLSNTTVLLATAIVQVRDASGRVQSFRALFDTGSQSNLITKSAVNRLKLQCTQTATRVSGLGGADASVVGDVTCSIVTNDGASFELDLCVLPKICGDQPITTLNTSRWSHIAELPLADPGFAVPGPIDILFAADIFAESLLGEQIKGSLGQPTAFKSIFGWLLVGKTQLAPTILSKAQAPDQIPPDEIVSAWNTYRTQLSQLAQLRIPRKLSRENVQSYELDGFADSSESAYGAVISTRCAAFVADRVSHIQDIVSTECWHNISSSDNPADVFSQGQFPGEILHSPLWWAGPRWLPKDKDTWHANRGTISPEDEAIFKAETRKAVALVTERVQVIEREDSVVDDLLDRYFSLQTMINVYINRFVSNSRKPLHANRIKFLNNVERHDTLMRIVKHVRSQAFAEEVSNIKANKPVLKPLRKLNPFLNDTGVLRVGGRISRSDLEYEQKHRAFLPSDHRLTELAIDVIHRHYCHPGINTAHFLSVQQIWIAAAERTVHRGLSKYVQCYRTNPQPLQPLMNNLPTYRVNFIGVRDQPLSLMNQTSHVDKIEFKFNPPSVQHSGGIWEIPIKAAKSHLYSVAGNQDLTFEELTTLFIQIEALLNSKPLCSDPNDLSVLTPGHFLRVELLATVPDEDLTNINKNRPSRWQLLRAFHRNFRSRWKRKYLNSLTQRAKSTKDSKPLHLGSMVIIKDPNRAPLHWPIGRVMEFIPGGDGLTRIAVLKSATSDQIQQSLVELCPLAIED